MEHRGRTCKISVSFAWWWPLYMHGLVFFCLLMDAEPNPARVDEVVMKALRTKVEVL